MAVAGMMAADRTGGAATTLMMTSIGLAVTGGRSPLPTLVSMVVGLVIASPQLATRA